MGCLRMGPPHSSLAVPQPGLRLPACPQALSGPLAAAAAALPQLLPRCFCACFCACCCALAVVPMRPSLLWSCCGPAVAQVTIGGSVTWGAGATNRTVTSYPARSALAWVLLDRVWLQRTCMCRCPCRPAAWLAGRVHDLPAEGFRHCSKRRTNTTTCCLSLPLQQRHNSIAVQVL